MKQLDTLSAAKDKASDDYDSAKTKAQNEWLADAVAQSKKQTFAAWAVKNDPDFIMAQRAWKTAEGRYWSYYNQVYGANAGKLVDQANAIYLEADDQTESQPGRLIPCAEAVNGTIAVIMVPAPAGANSTYANNVTCYEGYNMATWPGAFNVSISPWVANTITGDNVNSEVYLPLYQLPGIVEQCNTWLQGGENQPKSVVQLDLKASSSRSWSEYGQSSGTSNSGWSVWGIVGSKSSSSSSTSWFDGWGTTFTDDVSIQYSFGGATVPFTIRAGVW